MMRELPGTRLPHSPVADLHWVRDLLYYDGPLLAEFRNPMGEPYLLSWCDSDETLNRWLAVRVPERDLIQLTNCSASLGQTLRNPADGMAFLVDIDDAITHVASAVMAVSEIPDDYLPKVDAPLPASAPDASAGYATLLNGTWKSEDLLQFPHTFQQLYLAMYTYGRHMQPQVIRPQRNHPWKGGYSTVAFYKRIKTQTPPGHQPAVQAFAYASPGYVKWSLHRPTALAVREAVDVFAKTTAEVQAAAKDARRFVKDSGLNRRDAPRLTEADPAWQTLEKQVATLLEVMPFIDATRLRQVHANKPFALLKILLSIHDRLERLRLLEARKLLEL